MEGRRGTAGGVSVDGWSQRVDGGAARGRVEECMDGGVSVWTVDLLM